MLFNRLVFNFSCKPVSMLEKFSDLWKTLRKLEISDLNLGSRLASSRLMAKIRRIWSIKGMIYVISSTLYTAGCSILSKRKIQENTGSFSSESCFRGRLERKRGRTCSRGTASGALMIILDTQPHALSIILILEFEQLKNGYKSCKICIYMLTLNREIT